MKQIKGNKKVIRGWIMYDWANSAYQLTVTTVVFPIYFQAITKSNNPINLVDFFGLSLPNTVILSLAIATAFLFTAILSPFLSAVADYTGEKKAFMKFFTYLGALSCIALFWLDKNHIELGVVAYTTALIGYLGSLVFYNSYLPEIAEPKDHDRISAQGFAMGYVGGIVLLAFNLVMLLKPEWFGFDAKSDRPAQISFLTVGIWWIAFAQYTFLRLPRNIYNKSGKKKPLRNGYKELQDVWRIIWTMRPLRLFLAGFFFYTMGLLTMMYLAPSFGTKVLGIPDDLLIETVVGIQLLGVIGALAFSRLSKIYGNIKVLIGGTLCWAVMCCYGYFMNSHLEFVIVACSVGLFMGGMQALSRSTYSKMLPETTDNTSFFSFYDIMEKLAAFAGTASFGLVELQTESMRYSLLAMSVFFIVGMLFLLRIEKEKKANLAN
jgi:MFS transporter, UMF1 family